MNHISNARKVFDIEIQALKSVKTRLDNSFEQAVDLFLDCVRNRGKIVVTGVGKSGLIGRKIAATLASTGATSVVLDAVDALHGDIGIICDGDVVLVLSYSGETEEIKSLLPVLKRFKVKLVSMTGSNKSTLAKYSDVVMNVKIQREACPFNLVPTSSTTVMLVLGDALAIALLKARGLKKEDYARFHPAGAIGKTLLLKASDIMRTGERNPVASCDITVKEGLLIMTGAKAGCLSLVNSKGKLVGVFTDGDFRRHIAQDETVLAKKLKEVMTPNPICIRDDALAAEAVKIFNEKNIDDLIVVNSKREPVGIIDSQDLPKLKLM
ncbi:MAG: KpsF/GutQ family sugar-phosphate isomerase [Verrucomicrobiia bacterium]|jgi:arabinose-5-phosphate isomerase